MKVRIQPSKLAIPDESPFANDLLDRYGSAELLTHIVSQVEGPCVLAIDAAWGSGKTTFLRMWERSLQGQKFPVVAFNAWETDFTSQPFLALSTELTQGLESYSTGSVAERLEGLKNATEKVVQVTLPKLMGAVPMVGGAAEAASNLIPFFSGESGTDEYQKAKNAFRQFAKTLTCLARELIEKEPGRPLIIMIDELDRCRPSYAIELLEIAKLLFSVDHVIFVLAINRTELAHSVKAMYGSGFDAEGYLRRFIDLDFRLPTPDRERFVTKLLQTTSLELFLLDEIERGENRDELQAAESLLKAFLGSSDLSLRRVQQAAHRLGLIFSLLPKGSALHTLTAVLAIVLRTVNLKVYHGFLHGQVTDKEVGDTVFSLQGMESLLQSPEKSMMRLTIEVQIILSMLPITPDYQTGKRNIDEIETPLLVKYRQMKKDRNTNGNNPSDANGFYAATLLEQLNLFQKFPHLQPKEMARRKFIASIQNLELLSSDLGKENP